MTHRLLGWPPPPADGLPGQPTRDAKNRNRISAVTDDSLRCAYALGQARVPSAIEDSGSNGVMLRKVS